MPRHILPESQLHPAIRDHVADLHGDLIEQVMGAMAVHRVVVGMAGHGSISPLVLQPGTRQSKHEASAHPHQDMRPHA